MLDENIWLQLSEDEKFDELQSYLNAIIDIEKGRHELSNTRAQGRLSSIRKELQEKIFKIIELENAT
jgi:hypothetical protein